MRTIPFRHIVVRYILEKRPAQLSAIEYRALAEFRYRIRRFLRFSEQAARRAGLEPAQHQLLLAVKAYTGEPTVGNLAERLQARHHSVVGLADRLAESGLVKRNRAAVDRREVRIRLTAKGEAVLRKLSLEHRVELGTEGGALAAALQAIVARKGSPPDRRR
jgi:DNA-binding MarR family transcriptional regulator